MTPRRVAFIGFFEDTEVARVDTDVGDSSSESTPSYSSGKSVWGLVNGEDGSGGEYDGSAYFEFE